MSDVRWTQGGRKGGRAKNNAEDHPFERSTAFSGSRP